MMEDLQPVLRTQQRRLRHLKSISIRNLQYNGQNSRDISVMQIYFSLHAAINEPEFFQSEKIQGSVNPSWKGFTLDHFPLKDVNTTSTLFVVKIWRSKDKDFQPCIIWEVNLTGLQFLGHKLPKEVLFSPNTLLFGMHNGFYIAPQAQDEPISSPLTNYERTVDQSVIRKSYSVSTLSRVQTILRAIKQTEASGGSVRGQIENKLFQTQSHQHQKACLEDLKTQLRHLQDDLEWRTQKLRREKEHYETLQTRNTQRDMFQRKRHDTLKNDRYRLHERKKKYFDVREELIKNGAQLVMRRKQLISELAFIYPIRELPNNVFTVAGVSLPNSTEFQGSNEVMLEVSLGYTCHLVHMISHFLDMPLRYPMEHRGSKSLITDHILDKLGEKDRDFPVFMKGKEKFQFEYGVYLLNKNIAQLRYYCGLGTTDLRLTLPNLKTLLQLRLGVKFDHFESYDHSREIYASIPSTDSDSLTKSSSETRATKSKTHKKLNLPSDSTKTTDELLNNDLKVHQKEVTDAGPSSYLNDTNESSNSSTRKKSNRKKNISETISENSNSLNNKEYNEDIFTKTSYDDDNFFTPVLKKSENTASDEGSQEHVRNNKPILYVDIDVHSIENPDTFQTPLCDESSTSKIVKIPNDGSDKTFDQVMKEKLLGPLANYQDLEVSSSEDSANAAYGSKMWPRMVDNMAIVMKNDSDEDYNDDGIIHNNDKLFNSSNNEYSSDHNDTGVKVVSNLVKCNSALVHSEKKCDTKSDITASKQVEKQETSFPQTLKNNSFDNMLNIEKDLQLYVPRTVSVLPENENNDNTILNVTTFKTIAMHNAADKNNAMRLSVTSTEDDLLILGEEAMEDNSLVDNEIVRRISEIETGDGLQEQQNEVDSTLVGSSPTFQTFEDNKHS